MTFKNPPEVNGIMQLNEQQILAIQTELQQIEDAFVPTEEQPVCDIQYLTATYNKQNVGNEINGDTMIYCRAYGLEPEV